jgi:NAD(P)H-dependent flavin oxidoreductase YrpB (nitropropane dioxygenase family)
MNDLTTPSAVRVVSLAASVAITALIISVHAADMATLGARDVVARGTPAIGHMHASDAQPAPRLALVAANAR